MSVLLCVTDDDAGWSGIPSMYASFSDTHLRKGMEGDDGGGAYQKNVSDKKNVTQNEATEF